ncbi:MAG: anthrone oxygenase family protein [Pseudomonadota bacterium]
MYDFLPFVTTGLALGAALVAGVFFAFSDFVMRSLADIEAQHGMVAMQSINRKVYRSGFLPLLMGLGPILIGVLVASLAMTDLPGREWLTAGAAIYLVGVIGVTVLGNVPMNKRLDRGTLAADYWPHYQVNWTILNHVRTVASIIAAFCFLIAGMS